MSDTLFEIGTVEFPDWYTPSNSRRQANLHVLKGKHPTGHELGGVGSCGSCKYRGGHRFKKCSKSKVTNGAATDIVAKWAGCVEFDSWDTEL